MERVTVPGCEQTEPISRHPTISVIIPAYNAAEFVGRAIESALSQTYPVLEILVIDDGSADHTTERVAEYPAPVRLLRQEHRGPSIARNRGAAAASGEWLAFLDADDLWLPRKSEAQLPYLADPSVALVHARCPGEDAPMEGTFEALWRWNFILTSSVLLRRTAFEDVGGFDEDGALIGAEDYNLWLRLAARGYRIVAHPEMLHEYTPAPGHLSGQVELCARAELANLDAIGRCRRLDPAMVREKQRVLYEQYGRSLFHVRQLGAARHFLGQSLLRRPSPRRLAWWLATFIPPRVLDWRRQLAPHVGLHLPLRSKAAAGTAPRSARG